MNDYLRSHGVAEVGLYSTGYQWREITGGYTASSAADYRKAWKPQFKPMYSLDNAPLWLATYTDRDVAKKMCSTSFTGAKTRLVQYGEDGGGFRHQPRLLTVSSSINGTLVAIRGESPVRCPAVDPTRVAKEDLAIVATPSCSVQLPTISAKPWNAGAPCITRSWRRL